MKKIGLLYFILFHSLLGLAQTELNDRMPFSEEELNINVGECKNYVVSFKVGACAFNPEFSESLNRIVQFLNLRKDLSVMLNLYTDSRNTGTVPDMLNYCRVGLIEKYIISKGIEQNRIFVFSASTPFISDSIIIQEKGEDGKEKYNSENRRLELKILSTKDDVRIPLDSRKKFDMYNLDDDTSLPSEGDVCIMKVLFSFTGGGHFYPEYTDTLNRLVMFLKAHPSICVEISAHVDSRGGLESSRKVTKLRCERIGDFLKSKNIPVKQFILIGKGEDEPLVAELDINKEPNEELRELYHSLNRRIEVKIVSTKLN